MQSLQNSLGSTEVWIDKISLAYNNWKNSKPFKIHGPATPTSRPIASHHWLKVSKEIGKIDNVVFWVHHTDVPATVENLQPAVIIYDWKKPIYLIEESEYPRFFGFNFLPDKNVTRCGNKIVPLLPHKMYQSLAKSATHVPSSLPEVDKVVEKKEPRTSPQKHHEPIVATAVAIPQTNTPTSQNYVLYQAAQAYNQQAYGYEQVKAVQQHNEYLKMKIQSAIKKYNECCLLYQEKDAEVRAKNEQISKLTIEKQQLEFQNKTLEDKANHYKELYESVLKFRKETGGTMDTKQNSTTQTEATTITNNNNKRPIQVFDDDDVPLCKRMFLDLNEPDE